MCSKSRIWAQSTPCCCGTHTFLMFGLCPSWEDPKKNHSKTFNVPVNRQTDYHIISHVSKKYPWLCTRRSERSESHRKPPIFSEHLLYPMLHPEKAANANSSKTHMAYSLSATKFSCTDRSPICEAQCGFCQLNSAKPGGPTDTKSPLVYLVVYAVLVWSSQWKVPCFPGNSLPSQIPQGISI